jgi:hypothetical protein
MAPIMSLPDADNEPTPKRVRLRTSQPASPASASKAATKQRTPRPTVLITAVGNKDFRASLEQVQCITKASPIRIWRFEELSYAVSLKAVRS